MLAVFLAATSFAPGAPLRGAVVAPRRAAAPVAAFDFADFDTLHSVTTQIAELVDADGERVYGAVDAPGWVAPVGAVVIAFFTTLLPMCACRSVARPRNYCPPLTPPPPSTARSPRARRPSRACRRPRRAASDRVTVASRAAAAAAARVAVAHMLFEV